MSAAPFRSLIVTLEVGDEAACAGELARQRAVLEAGWAALPALHAACLALLPATARRPAGLLFACEFEGELRALSDNLGERIGEPLRALFEHCSPVPSEGSDALYRLLSARAMRAVRAPHAPLGWLERSFAALGRARARLALSLRAPRRPRPASDDARRSAVGMQQMARGVPLLHLSHLGEIDAAAARRVKRVLRDLERAGPTLPGAPRCWADGERVLLLAQPSEVAPLWAERVAQRALGALTALWLDTREFSDAPAARGPRGRYVWRFLLDQRLPIGAWYHARV